MRTYRHQSRGLARGLWALCALALLPWTGSAVEAQQRRFLAELGAGAVYQSFSEVTDLGSAFGGVGRIGIWLPLHFSIEGEAAIAPASTQLVDSSVSVRSLYASLLYNIPVGPKSWAHLRVGGGSTKYREPPCPRGIPCGTSGALMAGAGVRVGVTPDLFIRGDAVLSRNRSEPPTGVPVNFTNLGMSLSLSYMLGSKPIPDSDGDGVLENRDRCPDTPSGAQVDETGCPSDSDGDGVPDGVDRCANTPPGASVNASGCTQDSDGDNIPDGLDRCPDTEAGVLVDPNGCPKDSDGDSIPDGLDRCSDTPRGATVDALGCPGDEDGDGVLDGLDRCPRTPTGAAVNSSGCPTGQGAARPAPTPAPGAAPQPQAAAPRPQPPGRTPAVARGQIVASVLPGVGFAPGTARLRPESYVTLDSIAEILKADTTVRVEIGAHTDNAGVAAQNQHLSNLQADAVRTYLVTKGVNFQQVQARGYGGSVPLTTDNTPRGRMANRRVEIKRVLPGP